MRVSSVSETAEVEQYINGGLKINTVDRKVYVNGKECRVTPLEFEILLFFITHVGQVYSASELYEQVWGEAAYGAANTVAVHIRHIREKIETVPKRPKYLKIVWGVGYRMEDYSAGDPENNQEK